MGVGEDNSVFICNMGIMLRSSPALQFTDASKTKLMCPENGRKVGSMEGKSPVLFILVNPEVINQGQFCHPQPPQPTRGPLAPSGINLGCHNQECYRHLVDGGQRCCPTYSPPSSRELPRLDVEIIELTSILQGGPGVPVLGFGFVQCALEWFFKSEIALFCC